MSREPAVLVVEDEQALETLSDRYDAVLLDRRMPVVPGSEVLAYIEEHDFECRVAMVTAVSPDFDIIDLRIDEYLVKPITQSEMHDTVERLLTLQVYTERLQELTSKKLKRNVIRVENQTVELEKSAEFQALNAEIDALESEVETIADDLGVDNIGTR